MIYKLKGTITSAIFIISVLLILSFFVLTPMISMIILGAVFAYVIRSISNKMLPYLKFETVTIIVAMILVILPLIAIVGVIINSFIESIPLLVSIAKSANIGNITSSNAQQYIPSMLQTYNGSILDSIKLGLEEMLKYIGSLPTIGFQLFIFFAATFYFTKDGDKLWEYIQFTIPDDRTHYFDSLFSEVERVLKSIFYGHFFTALLTGILAGFGFWILGYPFASFLGILTGFFQVIPFIGHWPLPIILSAYDILTGDYLRAIAAIILGFLMSTIDIYLRPKISSRYADIHPLIFILGFLCGPLVFGLVGFILGPLILGVTYAAVSAYKKDRTAERADKVNLKDENESKTIK